MLPLLLTVSALAADPVLTNFAGVGKPGYTGDGGPAAKALLREPFDLCHDAAGNLFFSDTINHVIRRVDAKTGAITTVAGSGKKGYSGDGGPATQATMNEPYGVLVDADGHLYIVDRLNYCVRKVDAKSGVITTFAGTGKSGYSGDGGPAAEAQLVEPNGIALDKKGRLFIADVRGQRVRVVDLSSGRIETFAGTGEKKNSGDGGPAKMAALLGSRAVAVSPDGAWLYICLREGHAVRRVNLTSGVIEPFAGTGKKGYSGDGGPASEATFNGPKEMAVDAAGHLFIVDTENHAIRRIDATSGIVTTVAGNGKASPQQLNRPHGVAVTADGTILIGDTNNHRIAAVAPTK
jgi:sugar lactone lactonase YvrE